MTTITITDPALIEELLKPTSGEFRDASGRLITKFVAFDERASIPETTTPLGDDIPDSGERPHESRHLAELFAALEIGQQLRPPPGMKSLFTEEERRENRKQTHGRPLKDILADLEKLA